jgi:hypothetical protein
MKVKILSIVGDHFASPAFIVVSFTQDCAIGIPGMEDGPSLFYIQINTRDIRLKTNYMFKQIQDYFYRSKILKFALLF